MEKQSFEMKADNNDKNRPDRRAKGNKIQLDISGSDPDRHGG